MISWWNNTRPTSSSVCGVCARQLQPECFVDRLISWHDSINLPWILMFPQLALTFLNRLRCFIIKWIVFLSLSVAIPEQHLITSRLLPLSPFQSTVYYWTYHSTLYRVLIPWDSVVCHFPPVGCKQVRSAEYVKGANGTLCILRQCKQKISK
jgi:hypothetical protein